VVHRSVSVSISTIPDNHANENTPISTSVPSVENQSTAHSRASASDSPNEDNFLIWTLDVPTSCAAPPHHVYFDSLQHQSSPHDSDSDYSHINTPYSADGFDNLLACTKLIHQYPELTWKLRNSFPIGKLEPLLSTYTPNNLPGANVYKAVCDEYIADKLSKGRFSGLYMHDELFSKIGHFRLSPIQVVVKAGINGAPDKYRVCCHLSYRGSMGHSINDEIDSSEYPTTWGTATEFADIVCRILSYHLAPSCHTLPGCTLWFFMSQAIPVSFIVRRHR
jgi:hypothetical protein